MLCVEKMHHYKNKSDERFNKEVRVGVKSEGYTFQAPSQSVW